VIDEHNLEAPRLRRVGRPWLARLVGAVERAALRQAAMVVAVSEEDAIALQDEYGLRDRPHVAPNGYDAGVLHVDAGRRTSTRRAMGFRDDECVMIFVGDVVYAPNRDAVRALRDQVLPAVLKILPTARLLLVAGPGEPPGASHERATNLGSVPDVAPILNAADVLVAPLWSGGGTKLKVIEALATGLAVVTTPEGVRGLEECRSLDAVRVVDRVEDMPQAVRDLFASYRRAAPPDWFVERFEWKPIGQRLLRALQERGLL
jgi:glycosyltransferase involved in cell wall biosynthesis